MKEMVAGQVVGTMNRAKIERFVQGTLGCGCPPEVFEEIRICADDPCPGLHVDLSMEIGGRLLMYVVFAGGEASLAEKLPAMVEQGRSTRDIKGFNRFRLVVAVRDVSRAESVLRPIFDALSDVDEKIHLHVIEDAAIGFLRQ